MKLKVAAALVFLSGCATQGTSTFDYSPSQAKTIKNEKTVARPPVAVWDELVRELSKSFYVINNIERESRIINVSFHSNAPADYVDCGRSNRTYTQGDKTDHFSYAVADKSQYKIATPKQPHPSFAYYGLVDRQTSLEGRANIYVAPDPTDNGKTTVSVNTRYILTIKTTGNVYAQHANGNINVVERIPERTNTEVFNTNKPSSSPQPQGLPSLVCAGTGKLETEILNMVK